MSVPIQCLKPIIYDGIYDQINFYTPIIYEEEPGIIGYLTRFHNIVERFFQRKTFEIHLNKPEVFLKIVSQTEGKGALKKLAIPIMIIFKTISFFFINNYDLIKADRKTVNIKRQKFIEERKKLYAGFRAEQRAASEAILRLKDDDSDSETDIDGDLFDDIRAQV